MIKVNKPLAFFDLETTGISTADDRIVSIAVKKYLPDGSVEDKYMLVNPEMPIPEGATKVHGITSEMVKDSPTFKKISKGLHAFLEGCDLAGFNIVNFDIPLLAEEFLRVGLPFPLIGTRFLDACTIYRIKEARTLSAGYKYYCGKEMTDAHNAQADVNATCEVLEKQMELYGMDVDAVVAFCKTDNRVDLAGKIVLDSENDYVYNFGKSKGVKIKKDTSFAVWMLSQSFISKQTKETLKTILEELKK